MRPQGDYTTRVERGLPPEVRPVARPSAGFWRTALGAVLLLIGVAAYLAVLVVLIRPYMRINRGGATKGNLGAIRSSLSIYYGDMEGYYPLTPYALTVSGKYMWKIPKTQKVGPHPDSAHVAYGSVSNDAGGWLYANDPADKANYGTLWVNCTHTDRKGSAWTSY